MKKLEEQKLETELDVLVIAGNLISTIYHKNDSELITKALEEALDALTVEFIFYKIALGKEND